MEFDVWKTLYADNFDVNKYLYHYTSIDTAIKIIHSGELRFASINNTNDTSESKLKIIYIKNSTQEIPSDDIRVEEVNKYFQKYRDVVRLLCFSMDSRLSKNALLSAESLHKIHPKDKFYDISGRGFALPRMWAQYAANNSGLCFIINKEKFEQELFSGIEFCKHAPVIYKGFFASYQIDERKLNNLYKRVSKVANGGMTLINLMETDPDFLKYNFFEKLDDWKNEHEYRYVSLTDSRDNVLSVDHLFNYVEAIVVGEKVDLAYENVIRKLVTNRCDVKKVFFDNRVCKVK